MNPCIVTSSNRDLNIILAMGGKLKTPFGSTCAEFDVINKHKLIYVK